MNHFLSVLVFILVTATTTHASTSQQVYWHIMLPNSPMPKAIMDLISSDDLREEKTLTIRKGADVNSVKIQQFFYQAAATETQLIDNDSDAAFFFLEKDLMLGSQFDLRFTKTTYGSPFISHSQANTIPFSSNRLPEILTRFQVKPRSFTAKVMEKTLAECEVPAMNGESKLCATSLESMIEFSMMTLGSRDVQASSTTVVKEKNVDVEVKKTYNVTAVHALGGEKLVACHAQPYLYAVFYCHDVGKSKVYKVALEGNDKTNVEALVVCHLDTSNWNPKNIVLSVLKVKPGSVPVCHFMLEGHVVWTVREQELVKLIM